MVDPRQTATGGDRRVDSLALRCQRQRRVTRSGCGATSTLSMEGLSVVVQASRHGPRYQRHGQRGRPHFCHSRRNAHLGVPRQFIRPLVPDGTRRLQRRSALESPDGRMGVESMGRVVHQAVRAAGSVAQPSGGVWGPRVCDPGISRAGERGRCQDGQDPEDVRQHTQRRRDPSP